MDETGDSSRGQVTQLMITDDARHLKDCAVSGDTDPQGMRILLTGTKQGRA